MKYLRLLLVMIAVSVNPIISIAQKDMSKDNPILQLQKFNQFYRYLYSYYVDTINNTQIVDEAIRGALSKLDPHSAFVSSEEMVAVNESFGGSFSGIGIEFNVLNDTLMVVNVISGGPSESVGLLPNDRIVEVDGRDVIGIKRAEVPKILRGPKNSIVKLKVIRRGSQAPLDFTIKRDDIPINTVDAAYVVEPGIGYIKINRFAKTTFDEFREAFDKLGNIKTLILDLRGNGGGLLDQAVSLAGFFLPDGATIVSTEGRNVPPEKFMSHGRNGFGNRNLIVLVDEGSASASEIVSGAVQDWDRGVLIGRRTFGKGLVQRQFPLADGSAVRITVARYHTPTGRVIQRPFEQGHKDQYYNDLAERIKKGDADSISGPDSLKYQTLVRGRTVYGGGGIYPDIYVDADTSGYTTYWGALLRGGVLSEFVIDYVDKNRSSILSKYPVPDAFVAGYVVDDFMFDNLAAFAEKKGIARSPEEMSRSSEFIKTQLKAMIAQKLWTFNEYFRVVNGNNDPLFGRAVEAARDWENTLRIIGMSK